MKKPRGRQSGKNTRRKKQREQRERRTNASLFPMPSKRKEKKTPLTIFPAAVGLSAAAMLRRYLPFLANDFLTMSLPPEERSTVCFWYVCKNKRGERKKKGDEMKKTRHQRRRRQRMFSPSFPMCSLFSHVSAPGACAAGSCAPSRGCPPPQPPPLVLVRSWLRKRSCILPFSLTRKERKKNVLPTTTAMRAIEKSSQTKKKY